MSIKRYDIEVATRYAFINECESEKGYYVRSEDHAAEVARLNEQVRSLAGLAEERREFIVNGVEFGYIRIPDDQNDKATGTYERCLLKPKYAADAMLKEVMAQAVEGFAKDCDDNFGLVEPEDEELYVLMAEAAKAYAAKLLAGEKT